jgi:hypothetical protein
MLIGVAQIFAVLFPIAWLFRDLGKFNPLWFVLDDSRLNNDGTLSEDYRIYLEGYEWRPLGVFAWHVFRNRVWNFKELFKVKNGNPEEGNQDLALVHFIEDSLQDFNGRKIPQDGIWQASAGLKFIGEPGDDPWQVFRGDTISKTHSIIGRGEIYYITKDGYQGWRKTSCELKKVWWMFGAERWVTTYRGTNSFRYTFTQKYQKDRPKAEW